ncbi:hypothetical protein EC988_008790 [Linderina pennispora]|nr:hypothetical protein EC988_008790 [Linderina pennispora]
MPDLDLAMPSPSGDFMDADEEHEFVGNVEALAEIGPVGLASPQLSAATLPSDNDDTHAPLFGEDPQSTIEEDADML